MNRKNNFASGDKFYRWTCLGNHLHKRVGKQKALRWFVECKCECGTVKFVRVDYINKGASKSCGCLRSELAVKKGKSQRTENSYISWLRGTKISSSKHRGIDFHLELNEFEKIVVQNCHYCGNPPEIQSGSSHLVCGVRVPVNGIDRIDSSKGYEKGNCVPSCNFCNVMKNDMTHQQFLSHIEKIYQFNKERF